MGSTRAKIAVDAMGGDHAPGEIINGAIRATEELDVDILLVGDPEQINPHLERFGSSTHAHLEVVPSEGVIEMTEEPMVGLKRKRKASINVAMDMVKTERAEAVVSAGHSGAGMAAALLRLGRLKGIERPAIGAIFPTQIPNKSVIILDVGAIVDCRAKHLEQFGLMGTVYSKYVLGNNDPKVGLLNIGEESSKGNEAAIRAYQLLEANAQIPFIGNAEGRDVLSGNFDVIVCDGFVGNVVLKFAEAVGEVLLDILKEELPQGLNGQLGTALLKPNLKRIKQRVDHAEHGGGLLLGVDGICIISHGSSQAPSVYNAIRLAKDAVDEQVITRLRSFMAGKMDIHSDSTVSSQPPQG
ncbi:phosphate acyltransferase PlsX [Euhalothece natronophila Z-M001]|uniref:Phosphate acyltransferase n=1 Tax=Euhalothece natronophila Z-M001 TaxID=522448 RepID=A0A5B8NKQ4_9CHRO|nr:phosphate acyltransferase PlsX [Euhalothece natronophila]QDZ38895.1 phosphate acyltransferase PlsX [Euhalothece natronophila Z-M001]